MNWFSEYCQRAIKRPNKWIHYFDIYERHFSRFRGTGPTMIEIGVFNGASLAMWKAYFGKGSKIIGIDIKPECKQYEESGIEVFIGSQDDPAVMARVIKKYPKIDIVLDDGGHRMGQQIKSFELLFSKISATGVCAVEDTHTSYISRYGGGCGRDGTFIEYMKCRVDELTARFSGGTVVETDITRQAQSISFYDSMVVVEKRPQEKRITTKAMPNA